MATQPHTTRRALFAAAAGLPAAALALSAIPAQEPFDHEAASWIEEYLREGGTLGLVPDRDTIFIGSSFVDGGRSPQMMAAMTPANPLRPRIIRLAKAMISAGLI